MDLAAVVDRADIAFDAFERVSLALAEAIGEVEQTGAWHGDGARSLTQWVAWRWRLERTDAARHVRRAAVLADADTTCLADLTGEVGLGDLDVLAREGCLDLADGLEKAASCTDPAGLAHRLDTERAARLLAEQAEAVARGDAGSILELQARAAHDARRVTYRADRRNGTATISVTGPLDELEAYRDQLTADAVERARHEPAPEHPAPLAAVLYDQLCHHAPVVPTVVVHVTADLLHAATPAGTPLASSVLARLLDECRLEVHVDDPATGNILHASRTERLATGALRRSILARDGHCTWPGCTSSHALKIHHIVEWDDGGPTVPDNLTCLCGHHHRLLHAHRFKVVGEAPYALAYYRPDGSLLRSAAQTGWTAPALLEHTRALDRRARADHPRAIALAANT